MLEELETLPVCLVDLIAILPVLIGEHEVRLAGQREEGDFVEDGVQPETLDEVFNIACVVVAAGVVDRCEFYLKLLGGFEFEGGEEAQVGVVEVGTSFLEEGDFVFGDSDVCEL